MPWLIGVCLFLSLLTMRNWGVPRKGVSAIEQVADGIVQVVVPTPPLAFGPYDLPDA